MKCLLCDATQCSQFVRIKEKYFCTDCLTSTFLYKDQQKMEKYFDAKISDFSNKFSSISNLLEVMDGINDGIKHLKNSIDSLNRDYDRYFFFLDRKKKKFHKEIDKQLESSIKRLEKKYRLNEK